MNMIKCLLNSPSSKLAALLMFALTLSACGGGGGGSDNTPTGPTLNSISISPATNIVQVGSTVSFTATGNYSDNTSTDLTGQVSWTTTSGNTIASIDNAGVATGNGAGTVTVTASYNGFTPTASLTVTTAILTGVTISPAAPPPVAQGRQVAFTATGHFDDSGTPFTFDLTELVSWTSDNICISVDTKGIASTSAQCVNANITADYGGMSAGVQLTVTAPELETLTVTPASAFVPIGQNKQFYVTGTMTDGTTAVLGGNEVWGSTAPLIASVDITGVVTGISSGVANISVTHPGIVGGPITSNVATVNVELTIQMGGARQGQPLTLATDVSSLAGSSSQQPGSNNGTGTAAMFYSPAGITTDGLNFYVADLANHLIRQVTPLGVVTTLAGAGFSGSLNGFGTSAWFNSPEGITTDGTFIYVADTGNHSIRKITMAGAVTTVAGTGQAGAIDGTGTSASFSSPRGITSDGTFLYVSDSSNNKIRKIDAGGAVTTFMTGLNNPKGITTDGINLYVANSGDHTIRQIPLSGGVMTIFAGQQGTSGNVDDPSGTGTAKFWSPSGITTDGTYLYVADTENSTVRQIGIADKIVSTLAGTGSAGAVDNASGTSASFFNPQGITTDGTSLLVSDSGNNKIRQIQ